MFKEDMLGGKYMEKCFKHLEDEMQTLGEIKKICPIILAKPGAGLYWEYMQERMPQVMAEVQQWLEEIRVQSARMIMIRKRNSQP